VPDDGAVASTESSVAHAVVQVDDVTLAFENSGPLQFAVFDAEVLDQAPPIAEQHRDQVDLELVEHPCGEHALRDTRPADQHVHRGRTHRRDGRSRGAGVGYVAHVGGDRYANLSPGSLTAALRSFGRRYHAAVTSDPARTPDEIGDRTVADGRPVRQVVADAAATLEALAPALHRVLVSPEPPIPEAAEDDGVRAATVDGRVIDHVDRLGAAAERLANDLRQAPPQDLTRTGTTPSGTRLSAIDIARQAVRVAADGLLAVERAAGGRGNGDDEL
jgi:hypothetical protein